MSGDRLAGALEAFVRRVMSRVDYFALYSARVAAQNSDSTLELVVDDERMPGFSSVPIRHGIPGVRVTVAADARVLLGFEGGNPQVPYAALWGDASVTKLEINGTNIILNGGSTPVAKEGSATVGHFHNTVFALTAGPYPVVGTITVQTATDTIATGQGAQDVKVP